ncbi:hypothetical protein VTL71DRAFT_10255 [Oculimacula yallundae]|uniref:Zn(2)-C6 fungal-type domain-containing protein n=1 Tax=Oculimacula yallundae TaxID=86028 RepID=A0ABR4CUS9_9HELO
MEKRGRANVTQACDACRRRKMRCEKIAKAASEVQCKHCHSSGLECTFNLPANRRGPRPKKHHLVSGQIEQIDRLPKPIDRSNSISAESSSTTTLPAIDTVCPQEIFDQIIQDYLDFSYPIHPLFHIPTFKNNLARSFHLSDTPFFCFVVSLCGMVAGMLPRRFQYYQTLSPAFKASYPTVRDFIKRVHIVVQKNRDPDMHENMTMTTWGLAYTMFLSHVCIGQAGSGRSYKAEATAIVLDMACHRLGTYATTNPIETQVRKKAFWITVASHVCLRITGESWDTLNDRTVFDQANADELHVIPLDDQYITAEGMIEPPAGEYQVATGFCKTVSLIDTMAALTKDPKEPKVSTSAQHRHQFSDTIGSCSCGNVIETASPVEIFQYRLMKVRMSLSELPEELTAEYTPKPNLDMKEMQTEILRVNLHVEHQWMQHILIDRLKLASMTLTEAQGGLSREVLWQMMEGVYLRLLAHLEGANPTTIAPNGHAVILKIRQVAASLLDFCPGPDQASSEMTHRAQLYLKRFTDTLSRLDSSYIHGQIVDLNISKQQHMGLTEMNSGNGSGLPNPEG